MEAHTEDQSHLFQLFSEFCLLHFEYLYLSFKFSESVPLHISIIISLFGHTLIQKSENCVRLIIKDTSRSTRWKRCIGQGVEGGGNEEFLCPLQAGQPPSACIHQAQEIVYCHIIIRICSISPKELQMAQFPVFKLLINYKRLKVSK